VAYFKVLSKNTPAGTEENNEENHIKVLGALAENGTVHFLNRNQKRYRLARSHIVVFVVIKLCSLAGGY
jgi:hypothetical protein